MEPPSSSPAQPNLAAALDRLWARFQPEIRERIEVIESAVQSIAANSLTAGQKEAAASAAHKLAGVLGTFSLHRGTDLARELELQFTGTPGPTAGLAALAIELRSIVENRA
jgi:HPt (histidine-containing phosphotransfer) domain-containing protein